YRPGLEHHLSEPDDAGARQPVRRLPAPDRRPGQVTTEAKRRKVLLGLGQVGSGRHPGYQVTPGRPGTGPEQDGATVHFVQWLVGPGAGSRVSPPPIAPATTLTGSR